MKKLVLPVFLFICFTSISYAACLSDSDGGNEPYVFGRVEFDTGEIAEDYCVNDALIHEYICTSGHAFQEYDLACNKCLEGQCIICTDTEESKNYLEKGLVTVNYPIGTKTNYPENCVDGQLTETYCENSEAKTEILNCITACNNQGGCEVCKPKTCSEIGKTCGTWDDGCGRNLNCINPAWVDLDLSLLNNEGCFGDDSCCNGNLCEEPMRLTYSPADNCSPEILVWAGTGEGSQLDYNDYFPLFNLYYETNKESWETELIELKTTFIHTGDSSKVRPIAVVDVNQNGVYDASDKFISEGRETAGNLVFDLRGTKDNFNLETGYFHILIALGMIGPFNIGDNYVLNITSMSAVISDPKLYAARCHTAGEDVEVKSYFRDRLNLVSNVTIIEGQQHINTEPIQTNEEKEELVKEESEANSKAQSSSKVASPISPINTESPSKTPNKIKNIMVFLIAGVVFILILGFVIGMVITKLLNKKSKKENLSGKQIKKTDKVKTKR
ncbi:MAG: hypothetical protein PHT54_02480 [Candidatus Nanoarchaeia archaeon]|nr:hypothetical protein [Candidatus Nanoarchaeia archaeon]